MTGGTGHDGRASVRGVAAVAATLAVVLLSAVGVAALRTDTASLPTVLRAQDATVELPGEDPRRGEDGEELPRGTVVTAGDGGAVLETRGREVHLGRQAVVEVHDGAHQSLRAGFVMVDAGDGRELRLDTSAATVETPAGALTRVERGALLRVGTFRGEDDVVVRAAGRSAETAVPQHYQVQVADGALPGRVTPLALTGDAHETALARDLVTADQDLTAFARTLDGAGPTGVAVLQARDVAVTADAVVLPAGAPRSEPALGFLVAAASERSGSLGERYRRVLGLRTAGGSWGVVAAIVSAPVPAVGEKLTRLLGAPDGGVLLAGGDAGDVGDLLAGAATGTLPGDVPAPPAGDSADGAPGTDGAAGDGSGGDGESAPPPPARPGPPAGSPPPPTTPEDPVPPASEAVEEVVDTVLDLVSPPPQAPVRLPPTPSPVPAPRAPAPAPTPLLEVEVRLPSLVG